MSSNLSTFSVFVFWSFQVLFHPVSRFMIDFQVSSDDKISVS